MPDNLTIRRANMNDAQDLFDWRNDPQTREMFYNTDPVQWEDHLVWLEKTLSEGHKILCIGQNGNDKIGTVRFDPENENTASLSITLNPAFRGLGLSTTLLTLSEKELTNNFKSLKAEVKVENKASLKAFQKAGYKITDQNNKIITLTKEIEAR